MKTNKLFQFSFKSEAIWMAVVPFGMAVLGLLAALFVMFVLN